jgi:hypothetical protein
MARSVLLRSVRSTALGNNTLTIRTFLFPRYSLHQLPHARRVFASYFSTGPPGDRGALHSWNVIVKLPNGRVPLQARGFPPVTEEQDRPPKRRR